MAQYTVNHNLPIYKTSRYSVLSLFTDLSITIGPKGRQGSYHHPLLMWRKLRHRDMKPFAQGHTISKCGAAAGARAFNCSSCVLSFTPKRCTVGARKIQTWHLWPPESSLASLGFSCLSVKLGWEEHLWYRIATKIKWSSRHRRLGTENVPTMECHTKQ